MRKGPKTQEEFMQYLLAVGSVPPTVDANTPQWLGSLAGMLKVLAPIALSLL
jgi:hypothetical protein